MAFYNTTHEKGATLDLFSQLAANQDEEVLAMMKYLRMATPSHVHGRLGGNAPLTSIRRSMNSLTEAGKLRKTTTKAKGPYGRPEHFWEYIEP